MYDWVREYDYWPERTELLKQDREDDYIMWEVMYIISPINSYLKYYKNYESWE